VHAGRRGKRVTRPTNDHDIKEMHVTGVTRTSTNYTALRLPVRCKA